MRRISITRLFLLICAVSMLTPAAAHAYIDPLSGSLVLQAVLAGVLGSDDDGTHRLDDAGSARTILAAAHGMTQVRVGSSFRVTPRSRADPRPPSPPAPRFVS